MEKMFWYLRIYVQYYRKDIDFNKLVLHLKMLPDAIKVVPLDGMQIREVTKVQTILTCSISKQVSK